VTPQGGPGLAEVAEHHDLLAVLPELHCALDGRVDLWMGSDIVASAGQRPGDRVEVPADFSVETAFRVLGFLVERGAIPGIAVRLE
jgi:hypothetical protein